MSEEILHLLSNIVELPQVMKADIDLRTYGLDSLKTMRLLVEIENVFNIEFDDDDLNMEEFSTLERIVKKTLKLL
ncbi:phosphopantetheine-binding protein [Cytobacillus praedii]|uniref:phosphopantetheine-binding protein n=1 Tax=Cytobacillus praedii TaxID=1742358 RepID=UPI002E1FEC6D|nr:phosphopantetheine-binding protein [Cytobacillus praedii]